MERHAWQEKGGSAAVLATLRNLLCLAALTFATSCDQEPPGALSSWNIARAADREGELTIYANTGQGESGPLLEAFHKAHPRITITFRGQNSADLYNQYLADAAHHRPVADLVWSSAMDLQIKLINDGFAQTYVPKAKKFLPTWAVWKNQGFGVTAEPIAFIFDKRRINPLDAPASHAQLRRFIEAGKMPGPVGTFDPERSGVGFLYYSQDRLAWADTIALNRAIGSTSPNLYESTMTLIDGINAGDTVFGYNVIGSYALERQRESPNLAVVFPTDYTLVMSRIIFISAAAPHPNAAKVFLDFILSREGQTLLAKQYLMPVRTDMAHAGVLGPESKVVWPIEVGPALLANLDQMRRTRLIMEWSQAIGPKRKDDFRRAPRDSIMTGGPP